MTHLLHIFSVARTLRFFSLLSWVVLSAACTSVNAPDTSSMLLKTAGGFQVGGEIVPVGATSVEGSKSGTVWANQLSVLYMVPAVSGGRKPVVLLPEFGLARDIYLETPDGREGWAMELLRAGYPVYLVEPAQSKHTG